MTGVAKDLRYAFRALRRQPSLSLVALLTLVIGIGANTAVFSLVKGVVLNPLPYPDPERIVVLWERKPGGETDFVAPLTFRDWRERARSFQAMAAFRHVRYGFAADEGPLDLPALRAHPALFPLLGAEPLLGRTFSEEEATAGRDSVVVLSHGFWQRHLGGRRDVIGREIELDSVRHTVVGVMNEAFVFPPAHEIQLWTPLSFDPNDAHGRSRRARSLSVVARLSKGVTIERAREEMSALGAAIAAEFPDTNQGWGAVVESAHEQLVRAARPALLLLLSAVGFLLLIACANVANLMLARMATLRKETALRIALGAGRGVLMRQGLAESVLLAGGGALLGVLAARVAVGAARRLPLADMPRLDELRLDSGVLLFTTLVSVAVALLCGVLPALLTSRSELRGGLSETARAGSMGVRRALGFVVAVEMALALVLLVGAGLTVRSFREMMRVDPGFSSDHLLAATIHLPRTKYPDDARRLAFFDDVLERLRALPGVETAAAGSSLPMHPVGIDFALPFTIEDGSPPPSGEEPRADIRAATHGYFETMKIPLVRGRVLDERDHRDAPHVLVVNETLARRYFADRDPLGRIVVNPHGRGEIVGVVADVKHYGLDAEPRPEIYLPFSQNVFSGMSIVVRTVAEPEELAQDLKRIVGEVDRAQAIFDISTMTQAISRWVFLPRLSASLLTVFALAALVLSCVGIYGVVAYSVSQRTTEMGLRMALGADAAALMRFVVSGSMRFVAAGMAAGALGSLVLTRLVSGQLFGVSRLDPIVYLAVTLTLSLSALAASYIPARRATRVDPIEALRVE